MIRIAFDVDHLRRSVLGLVAQRVNDDTAANRAIGASAACFRGSGNFQPLRLCVDRSQAKSKNSHTRAAYQSSLNEGSP